MGTFIVRYHIEDGYAGGSRPITVEIDARDFEGMDQGEIENTIFEIVEEHMRQNCRPVVNNLLEAVDFVKRKLEKIEEEEDA